MTPGVGWVTFSSEGWSLVKEDTELRVWTNADRDVLSLHFFAGDPDLGGPFSEIDRIRDEMRADIAPEGGALVEVEADLIGTLPAVRAIFKFPQHPTGMSYLGTSPVPRSGSRSGCFARKWERPAFATRRCGCWSNPRKASRAIRTSRSRAGSGIPTMRTSRGRPCAIAATTRNGIPSSPTTPLSRIRAHLRRIQGSIVVDPDVARSGPYVGPVPEPPRRSWLRRITGR